MKKCTQCNEEKCLTEFHRRGKYKDGTPMYHSSCKICYNKQTQEATELLFREKEEYLKSVGLTCCQVCGYDRCEGALEFHHLNPEEKEREVGAMMKNRTPMKTFINEVEKCVLLCANCHREVHAGLIEVD